jgi:L-asparaginase
VTSLDMSPSDPARDAGGWRPSIAVFSGPTATILNNPPLVTGSRWRERDDVPAHDDSRRFDLLRAQRLAKPVTVYVEAMSAHPLERDVQRLYAQPDGYLDVSKVFHAERTAPGDVPVYEVELRPEDGLYLLPYAARQADGSAWDAATATADADFAHTRQTFFPDGSRLFEEIDRFGLDKDGRNNILDRIADFCFVRAAPSGGYTAGLPADDIANPTGREVEAEVHGRDFFAYSPQHLAKSPPLVSLASLTNTVQATLGSGSHDGAIWLEGSPHIEETLYWLSLLIDTRVPICGNAAQRPHGSLSSDGDRNIVCSALYIRSRIWADDDSNDRIGAVLIQDERVFTARDVAKVDARPGGFAATGGHGGIVAGIGAWDRPTLTFIPRARHTFRSEVNMTRIPSAVRGVAGTPSAPREVTVPVKDHDGALMPTALPVVRISKHARYSSSDWADDAASEVEIAARVAENLAASPLSGFVLEGSAPYGEGDAAHMTALRRAVLAGVPVVRTGRGNSGGMVPTEPSGLFPSGSNLSATKARLLLMACLLRFGCPPPSADPGRPTPAELDAIRAHLADFQRVFDSH